MPVGQYGRYVALQMIAVEEIDDSFTIRVTARAPSVFLDHCTRRVISPDKSHRERLLRCFNSVGAAGSSAGSMTNEQIDFITSPRLLFALMSTDSSKYR